MQITNVICPTSKYAIKCPYEMDPDGIAVHNTANSASAMAEVSYMLGNNNKCSFHAAVDNYRVVTGLPFNRNAWHAGDGTNGQGNRNKIAIEICYSTGNLQTFEEAEDLAASYIAKLLRERNWGIERVSKHQDFSGKYCPHKTLDLGWERFLNKIRLNLNGQNESIQKEQENYGGELEMARTYLNGSTPEVVYADTNLTKRIGSLNPKEKCEYLAIDKNRPLVRYKVDGKDTYKCGYVRWKGGCK